MQLYQVMDHADQMDPRPDTTKSRSLHAASPCCLMGRSMPQTLNHCSAAQMQFSGQALHGLHFDGTKLDGFTMEDLKTLSVLNFDGVWHQRKVHLNKNRVFILSEARKQSGSKKNARTSKGMAISGVLTSRVLDGAPESVIAQVQSLRWRAACFFRY